MTLRRLLALFAGAALVAPVPVAAIDRVEIRNGRFYVDSEPFYARCAAYNGLRPHQRPGISYVEANRRLTALDFERMRDAHINTVRTWDALAPEELALARKYGLMVLQGIWLDPRQDFSDPHNQNTSVALVRTIAEQSRPHDNVLGYVLMTQPEPGAVVRSGTAETAAFFRLMKQSIQDIDPRPVSLNSWLPLAFLDHSMWDFVTFNTFAFSPASITHALGHGGYNRWLAEHFADGRPFIIGETGGYSVSTSSWSIAGGSGGWTEYEQSARNLDSLRSTIEGHADGACLTSWLDRWYFPRDPDTHDDEPWEWNGVYGIPTDGKKDRRGVRRQMADDLTRYNLMLPLEPKPNHIYDTADPIVLRVVAAAPVERVEYSANGGEWFALRASGADWWEGSLKLPRGTKRRARIAFRAIGRHSETLVQKEISIGLNMEPERLTITPLKGNLDFVVRIKDGAGAAIANRKVHYGFFIPSGWKEARGTLVTNPKGEVTLHLPLVVAPGDTHLFVAAGSDSADHIRTGDMLLIPLK